MTETTKENIKQKNTWIRLLYMILFVVVFNIAELVVYVVLVVQFIFHLFTRRSNERLAGLGESLALYVAEIVRYLTYSGEQLPYPFGDWPREQGGPARQGPEAD